MYLGPKGSMSQHLPVQSVGVSKSMNSLKKGKIVSRNAEVMAAREMMQNKIEDLKSELAGLAAAKKKLKAVNKRVVNRSVCSLSLNDDKCYQGNLQSGEVKGSDEPMKAVGIINSTKENVAACTSLVKDSRQDLPVKRECSDNLLKPAWSVLLGKLTSTVQGSTVKKEVAIIENPSNGCTAARWLSSGSEPTNGISVISEMENMTETKPVRDSPCSSPSRSAVKANLRKELKATEEKLQDMRKKMGLMLKESPQKSGVSARGESELHHHLRQALSNMKGGVHSSSSSTPTFTAPTEQRPFQNRTSLKWTPQKLPRRKSSEQVLVSGNSPNTVSYKKSSSSKPLNAAGRNITPVSTRVKRQAVRQGKSRYAFVRNSCTQAAEKSGSCVSQSSVTQIQKSLVSPACSKSFVSRFKVQRTHSQSQANSCAASLPPKTVVQSQYKLMKIVSKDSPHSLSLIGGGVSTPVSAKQKAAQVIKSKYKMRKVPLSSSPRGTVLQTSQPQHRTLQHSTTASSFFHSPMAVRLKGNKHAQFFHRTGFHQLPHPFSPASTKAFRGRGSFKQRINRQAASFQTGPWKRGFLWDGSLAGWGIPAQRSPLQWPTRQRVKALKVWKMQWKQQWRWGPTPYDQMARSFQMKRLFHRQQMLHLKRQQWMNAYSLRQAPISQKAKNMCGRRERLVMINGTVYRSSSSRLTKASNLDSVTKPAASTALLNSSVGGRRQRMMKTVMVRGVHFRVNSRGTTLRRVSNSAKKGKMAAISRADVAGTAGVQAQGALGKMFDSQTRYVINRVKQRSLYLAAAKLRRKEGEGGSTKKNCLYFCRFGKCSRGDACPFLHDPAKVAVCTRFLRGTCQVENCPFSHKVSKEKMPVCAFFLRGVCTRESCPYLHVKVSQGAQVCPDFISGFCLLADKCQKLHTLTCPQFAKTGTCPDGKKCRLLHKRHRGARKNGVTASLPSSSSSSYVHKPKDSAKPQKRSAESGSIEGRQNAAAGDGSTSRLSSPPPKCVKPDPSIQPEHKPQSRVSPGLQAVSDSSAAACVAAGWSLTSGGGGGGGQASQGGLLDVGGDKTRGNLPKLPAFISLADYSFEESPVLKVKVVKSEETSMQKKGVGLQIKPHF
ncbi:uncharacterized protein LOC143300193 [Babylonia areolata]|uniref:uncharacterized protein LOC143300193 n=1 Tax=Babylonia areolata TaxID=304850 RepID=UPI003FD575B0